MKNLFISITVAFVFLFVFSSSANASEGTVELQSATNEPYRCFAASLRMQNLDFKIPYSCRNLIYPAGEDIYSYIMWASPEDGSDAIRLGPIGLGKGEFTTRKPFSSLYVTTERNREAKTPGGTVVMRGEVQPIDFLEEELSPTPTPGEAGDEETLTPTGGVTENGDSPEQPQETLTTRQKLVVALKRAGIAAIVALVALAGLVFVVTRSRG